MTVSEHQLEIRMIVESWAVMRDAGDWDGFRRLWHPEGVMMATWFQGGLEDFIAANQAAWRDGVRILHFLGGSVVDVRGNRAVAQTKMTISQRAAVDGVLCDVVCTGRFYDFFEYRSGRWGLTLRQPIYERDRIDPVDPSAVLKLDAERLATFPEGYRHLAYLQNSLGFSVKPDMPGLGGHAVRQLYESGRRWLAEGQPLLASS